MRSKFKTTITLGVILSLVSSLFLFTATANGYDTLADEILHEVEYADLNKEAKKQVDCLAENIYHEAKAESEKGKLAVALVTMNRVKHERFPKDICSVVRQRTKFGDRIVCQFSWHCTQARLNRNSEIYQEALKHALHVYVNHNLMEDFTKGSLYFHADYVNPGWKLHRTVKIGRHIFYKEGGNNYATKTQSPTKGRLF